MGPAVGEAIRSGATQVEEASNNVPEDLNLTLQGHINQLINLTKTLQNDLKDGLSGLPELKDQVQGIPGEDYINEIIDTVPSADVLMRESMKRSTILSRLLKPWATKLQLRNR